MNLNKEYINIINLKEEKKNKENINKLIINNLTKEINCINDEIKNINEKLLIYKDNEINNNNKNKKSVFIPYKDLFSLFNNNNSDISLIAVKSEGGLKVELAHATDTKNINIQKKTDMNLSKNQYNDEYLNLCGFTNKLYLTSNNNTPINLVKIEPKYLTHIKDKEDNFNNGQTNNENEKLLNNIFGILRTNNIDNKYQKDSVLSDFSYFGNLNSFNFDITNMINTNNFL